MKPPTAISRQPAHGGRAVVGASLAIGVVGLAVCIVGFVFDAHEAYAAYLVAYLTLFTTIVGALILVMISHASGAKWFVVLRRLAETVAGTMPILVLLFVPLLIGLHELYAWVPPLDRLTPSLRASVLQKRAYLNVPFFIARAAAYFVIWLVIAALLRAWSVRQDQEGGVRLTQYQRRLAAGGLPIVGVALTFAAFDWMMSLTPAWYSTIYGVYVFAGGFVAALALVGLLAAVEYKGGRLPDPAMRDHMHALGKLLLTFVIFWAYIAFAQVLIIWIGGLPAEITWYAERSQGAWGTIGLVLVGGNFVAPFLFLLSRRLKRDERAMAALGVWLLVMHDLDVSWLALPALRPERVSFLVWDAAALAGTIGLATAYGTWQMSKQAMVPVGDPYLDSSLSYRSAV
jgi:hypothetical protein